jgi:hypothetical protein
MQESKKQTVSVDEKRAIVTMAETFRLEGHSNYLQKTSEATGVSHRRVVRYLEEWRKSKDEAGEIEVLNFMEDEWASAKQQLAFIATQANRKVLNHIHVLLDVENTNNLNTRAIKDLAGSLQVLSRESAAMMGESRSSGNAVAAQQSTVNIVLPPKGEMPIVDGEIEVLKPEGGQDASNDSR